MRSPELENPLARLCDMILVEGMKSGATSVRLTIEADAGRVSFEVSKQWHEIMKMPIATGQALLNRLRLLAGLDRTSRAPAGAGRIQTVLDGAQLIAIVDSGVAANGAQELTIHYGSQGAA